MGHHARLAYVKVAAARTAPHRAGKAAMHPCLIDFGIAQIAIDAIAVAPALQQRAVELEGVGHAACRADSRARARVHAQPNRKPQPRLYELRVCFYIVVKVVVVVVVNGAHVSEHVTVVHQGKALACARRRQA